MAIDNGNPSNEKHMIPSWLNASFQAYSKISVDSHPSTRSSSQSTTDTFVVVQWHVADVTGDSHALDVRHGPNLSDDGADSFDFDRILRANCDSHHPLVYQKIQKRPKVLKKKRGTGGVPAIAPFLVPRPQ
jgi:hypothetical protein